MMGVRGKVVAVVGRAQSLAGAGNGAAIDACGAVVRVNWMLPVEGNVADVGARTDLLYYCGGCTGQRAAAHLLGVPAESVNRKLRKQIARQPKTVRPTTGVVAIFDALLSGAREVRAFGFDFYTTGYASPAPPWQGRKVVGWRHEPAEDRLLLRNLLLWEPRFVPDVRLHEVLSAGVEVAA